MNGAEVAQLGKDMKSTTARCDGLEKMREKLERQVENLRGEKERAIEEGSGAKKEMRAKDFKIKNLETAKEGVEKEMEKTKVKLAAAEEKVKGLTQERGAFTADKVTADREARLTVAKVEAQEKELEKLRVTAAKVKE
ncbi:hypothetical protein T484DRAFT_1779903, partial [Baffinella frigidus]